MNKKAATTVVALFLVTFRNFIFYNLLEFLVLFILPIGESADGRKFITVFLTIPLTTIPERLLHI